MRAHFQPKKLAWLLLLLLIPFLAYAVKALCWFTLFLWQLPPPLVPAPPPPVAVIAAPASADEPAIQGNPSNRGRSDIDFTMRGDFTVGAVFDTGKDSDLYRYVQFRGA